MLEIRIHGRGGAGVKSYLQVIGKRNSYLDLECKISIYRAQIIKGYRELISKTPN